MNILEHLDKTLKERNNIGTILPEIRYFDGNQCFSTPSGQYKATTLEESLILFLRDIEST